MNPYSTTKAVCHGDRLALLKAGGHPAPVHLQLIPSNVCNHRCGFCAYRMPGYTSEQLFDDAEIMRGKDAVEILRGAAEAGVRAVQFTGGGEPTVHRDLHTLLVVARNLGLDSALVTNGLLMRGGILISLLACAWVRVSLDAGTEETYRKVRGVPAGTFDQVLSNVRELTRRRTESGSRVYVGLSFVVTADNWQDIPVVVEIAEGLGVDNLRFSAVFSNDDDGFYEGFGDEAAALCQQAAGAQPNGLLVSDNFSNRRDDLKQGAPDYDRCWYQHLTTYVGADQEVYRCCLLAYNERGRLGSLKGRTFKEFWNDPATVASLAGLNPRECARCQFNERNRAIQRIVDMIPERHGNFV